MKRPPDRARVLPIRVHPPPEEVNFDATAEVLLRVAEEVEEAEARLKVAILDAAKRGDTESIVRIVTRWQLEPPVTVAAEEAAWTEEP